MRLRCRRNAQQITPRIARPLGRSFAFASTRVASSLDPQLLSMHPKLQSSGLRLRPSVS
jgi:hypothetical protein